ncbi:MAG TPA: hypothetical protein VK590_00560, partial [Saprospiraceae bacterium]|nr:hypothetical protein [Saprospiraceae bacterium]
KASYQYGLKIGIQTNGFYTEKLNSVFPLIDWIAFPLDGISNESQIKMRTSSKHYTKFIDSVSLAIEYKRTKNNPSFKIKIGAVISKYNINELESMALFLSKTNIDVWKLYRIRKRGNGEMVFEDYHVHDDIVLEKINYLKTKYTSLNIYYSSDNLTHDSYIIIDPDSTTYVINQSSQKIFGKLITETGMFNGDLWRMIIEYANLKMITINIEQSFPGWVK